MTSSPSKASESVDQRAGPVHQLSSPDEKIALFSSLFRGREDVYPRRFESRKAGKSGYAPACSNEWVRGVCEKPRIKCAECPHRRFLPVTDDAERRLANAGRERSSSGLRSALTATRVQPRRHLGRRLRRK